jgi:hypothetical protein
VIRDARKADRASSVQLAQLPCAGFVSFTCSLGIDKSALYTSMVEIQLILSKSHHKSGAINPRQYAYCFDFNTIFKLS